MGQKVRWFYLLVIVLVTFQAAVHLFFSYRADRSVVGFTRGDTDAEGLLVDEVTPGYPAASGGLKKGDLIVGVNGYIVHTEGNYDSIKLRILHAGQPAQYSVLRNGAPVSLSITPYSRLVPDKFIVGILLVASCLLLGIFCYFKSPDDPRTRMLLLIFLSFASVDSWISNGWFGDWPVDRVLSSCYELMNGLSYGLLTLLPFFVPERKKFLGRRPWLALLFLAPGFVNSLLEILSEQAAIMYPGSKWLNDEYMINFSNYYLNAIFLVTPLVLLHTLKKATTPQIRNQAKTMLLGVTCWAVINSTVIALQSIYPNSWIADNYYATIVDFIIPLSVFFAIYKHRLFDIDVLIRKGLIYTLVSGALFTIYLLAIGLLGWLVATLFASTTSVSMLTNSLSTLLVGLAFVPVRRYSQRLIDRIFYREKYNYLEVVKTLFQEMPAAFSLEKLVETLSNRVFTAMRIKNLAVLIPDEEHSRYFLRSKAGVFPGSDLENRIVLTEEDPLILRLLATEEPVSGNAIHLLATSERVRTALELLGSHLVMPVLHQQKLVAVLSLGEKQSETRFDDDDLRFLTTVSRQAAMLMENARLLELATYDGLTQLMRRSAFDALLDTEIQRSGRYRRPLSLIMMDIDHFKILNDTYGHQLGDLVIKKVAATLKASLRATDTASGYGGEEFAVLLPEATAAAALVVAEMLRTKIESLDLETGEANPIHITVSLGIVTMESAELLNMNDLYHQADSALYRAKSGGRNRIEVYAHFPSTPPVQ